MPQQKFSENWKRLLPIIIKMELLLLGLALLGSCAFFSADPPPTEKTNKASLEENLLTFNQFE